MKKSEVLAKSKRVDEDHPAIATIQAPVDDIWVVERSVGLKLRGESRYTWVHPKDIKSITPVKKARK